MSPLLDDLPIPHHQNHIRLLNGGQAVRNNKAGPSVHHFGKCPLDLDFGPGVDRRGRFIQNEHGRQTQHYAGNAQKLLLSLGKVPAVFSDNGIVSIGQTLDKAVRMGRCV